MYENQALSPARVISQWHWCIHFADSINIIGRLQLFRYIFSVFFILCERCEHSFYFLVFLESFLESLLFNVGSCPPLDNPKSAMVLKEAWKSSPLDSNDATPSRKQTVLFTTTKISILTKIFNLKCFIAFELLSPESFY